MYPGESAPAHLSRDPQQHILYPDLFHMDANVSAAAVAVAPALLEDRGKVLPLAPGDGVHVVLVGGICE